MSLCVFFGLKNTPLGPIAAVAHTQLNILHRFVGYATVFLVLLHAIFYTVYFGRQGRWETLVEEGNVEGLAAGAPVLQPEADCAVGVVVAPVEGKQRTSTSAAAAVGRPTTTTSPRTFVFEAAPALSRDVLSPIVQTAPIDYDEDLAAVVAVHEPRLLCPREDGL